ncbi:MAG: hypothetical protein ACRC78_13665, partial [Planktothrix sp.]
LAGLKQLIINIKTKLIKLSIKIIPLAGLKLISNNQNALKRNNIINKIIDNFYIAVAPGN